MATTKERLDQLTRHRPEPNDHPVRIPEGVGIAAPRAEARPATAVHRPATAAVRTPIGVRLAEPISTRWTLIVAVAWVVLLAVGIAVEPPPTNPNAVDPWFVSALGTVLLVALASTFAGFWLRRRWSLAASLVAAGMLVVSTLMCPVSGHHAIGAWWVVQLGCGLGLVAASSLGLQRTAPRSASAIQ
jgi:hypothetical protein